EHHRKDFAVTAPDTILAALAPITKQITLGTGVTVLSSEDPVRVYQRFATIAALAPGRVEITAGRGSFIESFPLFGFDLADYEKLFEEKLDLLVALLKEEPVTWQGETRSALTNQQVYPKTEHGIALRVGVGGSPHSVIRAAKHGAALALAIIGGHSSRFAPFTGLYRESLKRFDQPQLPIGIHSPGHISDTDEQAVSELWPHYSSSFGQIGRERGWGPMTYEHYVNEVTNGSLYVGSPETVARKIIETIQATGANRFDLKYSTGPMPHSQLMRSIELYATKVIPMVRAELGSELAITY
ncbi:MAG: LLM class flavin-dependent oxidoreductase, partial [Microbacteriaceae bacterium]|nr:LLM class flavin-dependent oxidoreductase [Microbacteriaceae bacterium]